MNLEGMSLKKKFWRFVWPSVVAQWIFALYTMVDGMFVARGVSEVALSAVNIASPFVNFLFSVSILFAVGTSTVVAIFLGQGRQREANQANTQNMVGDRSLIPVYHAHGAAVPGPYCKLSGSHTEHAGVCKALYFIPSALYMVVHHIIYI